jgi:hypothetical protein
VDLPHDNLSEATFKQVMQTTEHLRLERIKKGWRNIMPEIVPMDQGMNDLIKLRLKDDSQLQCLVDTKQIGSDQVPNVFSKLVVLDLDEMNNLEELCNGSISFDSLNSLEELTIKNCGNLRSLFKGNLNLCNLKTVKISKCEQLENIFTYEKFDGDNDNNKSCNSLFSKLKVVKIDHCDKLTYIFDQEVKLDSLIELELSFVPNFINIFPKCDHSIEGPSNSISKPQTELQLQVEPIKSNIFSCCYRSKSTKVPSVVSQDQPQPCFISTVTLSSFLFLLFL